MAKIRYFVNIRRSFLRRYTFYMIHTIIFENNQEIRTEQVLSLILPGVRKILLGRNLRYSYTDFVPILSVLLKRMHYTKFFHKIFTRIDGKIQKLEHDSYQLPIILSVLHAIGLYKATTPFVTNGTYNISTGIVSFAPFLCSYKSASYPILCSEKEVYLHEILSNSAKFILRQHSQLQIEPIQKYIVQQTDQYFDENVLFKPKAHVQLWLGTYAKNDSIEIHSRKVVTLSARTLELPSSVIAESILLINADSLSTFDLNTVLNQKWKQVLIKLPKLAEIDHMKFTNFKNFSRLQSNLSVLEKIVDEKQPSKLPQLEKILSL